MTAKGYPRTLAGALRRIRDHEATIADLGPRTVLLELQVKTDAVTIGGLETRIHELQRALDAAETECVGGLETRIHELQRALDAAETECVRLRGIVKGLQEGNKQVTDANWEQIREIDELRVNAERDAARIREYSQKLNELEEAIQLARNANIVTRERLERAESTVSHLARFVGDLTEGR